MITASGILRFNVFETSSSFKVQGCSGLTVAKTEIQCHQRLIQVKVGAILNTSQAVVIASLL